MLLLWLQFVKLTKTFCDKLGALLNSINLPLAPQAGPFIRFYRWPDQQIQILFKIRTVSIDLATLIASRRGVAIRYIRYAMRFLSVTAEAN